MIESICITRPYKVAEHDGVGVFSHKSWRMAVLLVEAQQSNNGRFGWAEPCPLLQMN